MLIEQPETFCERSGRKMAKRAETRAERSCRTARSHSLTRERERNAAKASSARLRNVSREMSRTQQF
jgi:hypothetical protein